MKAKLANVQRFMLSGNGSVLFSCAWTVSITKEHLILFCIISSVFTGVYQIRFKITKSISKIQVIFRRNEQLPHSVSSQGARGRKDTDMFRADGMPDAISNWKPPSN